MQFIYDYKAKAWINLDNFRPEENFDPATNKKRLKVINDKYNSYVSKYYYIDPDDIKIVFKNGDMFGCSVSMYCNSSFNIFSNGGKNPVNYNKIKNFINEDSSFISKYMDLIIESKDDKSSSISTYSLYYSDSEFRKEYVKKKLDFYNNTLKKKLTDEQVLYVELNRENIFK